MNEPYQELEEKLHEAGSLIVCMSSQDVTDTKALELEVKLDSISAAFGSLSLRIDQLLIEMSDMGFERLIDQVEDLAFAIRERRAHAKEKMSLEKEILVNELSISGHKAYTTLYYTYIGSLRFPVNNEELNLSKLENLFSDTDQTKRKSAVDSMSKVLGANKSTFGQILNNIVDYRLRLYEKRGWDNYLHETLRDNRMSEETLNTMWKVVSQNKEPLKKYLDKKAGHLGLNKLSWYDLQTPIGDADETKIPWDKGCDDIINQFKKVSPKMADFAKRALKEGWVDSTPGENKRAGGFCTGTPLVKESRILMTYMDSFSSLSTLAHELGHAYHNEVIYEKPTLLQEIPMNLAESASTMCEMIVCDNALNAAKNDRERLILLDDKINRYLAFNMDLHSRFLFDKALHEERKAGFISPNRLDEMMVEAQKEGYANHLEEYLPSFWSYKMHFYFTDVTFYNWPYTFGYLFSLGLYAHLQKEGNFEESYISLLKDTGCMSVEDLASEHLNVDLTKPHFWQGAIDLLNADIETFLNL